MFGVSNAAVRGIEWCSQSSFLCYGFSPAAGTSSSASRVEHSSGGGVGGDGHQVRGRNELVLVDLADGSVRLVRATGVKNPTGGAGGGAGALSLSLARVSSSPSSLSKSHATASEPPVDAVRVSNSHFFFLVSVRATKIELWCLKSFECLYELESAESYLVAFDWAPVKCIPRSNVNRKQSAKPVDATTSKSSPPPPPAAITTAPTGSAADSGSQTAKAATEGQPQPATADPNVLVKERFLVMDNENYSITFVIQYVIAPPESSDDVDSYSLSARNFPGSGLASDSPVNVNLETIKLRKGRRTGITDAPAIRCCSISGEFLAFGTSEGPFLVVPNFAYNNPPALTSLNPN